MNRRLLLALIAFASMTGAAGHFVPQSSGALTADASSANAFVGEFSNPELSIEIRRADNGYTGTIRKGDLALPFSATDVGGTLRGTFRYGADEFVFSATLDAAGLRFTSDDAVYALSRRASNPLDRSATALNPLNPPRRVDPSAVGSTVKLHRAEIRDAGMGDIVSHTLLLPEDWKADGGVVWAATLKPMLRFNLKMSSPDARRQVIMRSGSLFTYADISPQVLEMMRRNGTPETPPGTPQLDGTIWLPPPNDAADYIMKYLLPEIRPDARDVRVETVREEPELAKVFHMFSPEFNEAQDRRMAQLGSHSKRAFFCQTVTVTYGQPDGKRYREDVTIVLSIAASKTDSAMNELPTMYTWTAPLRIAVRAPADEFAADEPLARVVISSVKETPQWTARRLELEAQIMKIEAEGRRVANEEFQKRQAIIAKTNNDLIQMHQKGVDERAATTDRMNHAFTNTMKEVDDFQVNAGETVALPNHYQQVFTNDRNEYILTNSSATRDALDQQWREIQPVKKP